MEMPGNVDNGAALDSAKKVLETLLDMMGLQAKVTVATDSPMEDEDTSASVILDISGEDMGILIGRRGQTLASLQYIVRIISGHLTQTRLPVIIDVEGYKRRRWEALRNLALRMADQVKIRKVPFTLEPMSAFERRIIHLTLSDHPEVITESTGIGDDRKVVILPKKLPEN